jgi:hypothetical protein
MASWAEDKGNKLFYCFINHILPEQILAKKKNRDDMSLAKCLSQLDTTYLFLKLVDHRLDFL